MKWSESPEFGFAIGRARALEPTMLDRSRYERLVTAPDGPSFANQTLELGYSRFSGQATAPSIEDVLAAAHEENSGFLDRYCPLRPVRAFFALPADMNNLKALVKMALGASSGSYAGKADAGSWSSEELAALAAARSGAQPEEIRAVVAQLLSLPQPVDPAAVDTALDVAGQNYLAGIVSGFPFLRRLRALRADAANILALVRVKLLVATPEELGQALIPGGELSRRELLSLHATDWEALVGAFRNSRCAEMVAEGIGFLVANRSLLRLERLAREQELRFLLQTRYVAFGYEPVLAFCLRRQHEATNLRLLYAAKLAGLPHDRCREVVACVD